MVHEWKPAAELIDVVNAEFARFDVCEGAKATTLKAIDDEGRWTADVECSGEPSDILTPAVKIVVAKLNMQYRLLPEDQ